MSSYYEPYFYRIDFVVISSYKELPSSHLLKKSLMENFIFLCMKLGRESCREIAEDFKIDKRKTAKRFDAERPEIKLRSSQAALSFVK